MRPTSLAHIVPVTIGPKRGHDREYVSIVAPAADLTPVFVVGILYSECFESCDVAIRAAQGGALTEIAEPVAWPLPDAPSCEMVFTGPQPRVAAPPDMAGPPAPFYTCDFHMLGRDPCADSNWFTKADSREEYDDVCDPMANLFLAYPDLNHVYSLEIAQRCFCCDQTQIETSPPIGHNPGGGTIVVIE